tara:strand:- start:84 stop:236 length:153 start_codon:yes stop_codon:yes gene_type:complete
MKIDDIFRDMMLMLLMDEMLNKTILHEKESSHEKIDIDLDEINKAEKMYE